MPGPPSPAPPGPGAAGTCAGAAPGCAAGPPPALAAARGAGAPASAGARPNRPGVMQSAVLAPSGCAQPCWIACHATAGPGEAGCGRRGLASCTGTSLGISSSTPCMKALVRTRMVDCGGGRRRASTDRGDGAACLDGRRPGAPAGPSQQFRQHAVGPRRAPAIAHLCHVCKTGPVVGLGPELAQRRRVHDPVARGQHGLRQASSHHRCAGRGRRGAGAQQLVETTRRRRGAQQHVQRASDSRRGHRRSSSNSGGRRRRRSCCSGAVCQAGAPQQGSGGRTHVWRRAAARRR